MLNGPRNAHGRRAVELGWSASGGLIACDENGRSCVFGPEVVQALRDASPEDARPGTVTFAEGPTGTGPGRRIAADPQARIELTLTRKDEAGARIAVVNVKRADGGLYNLRVPLTSLEALEACEEEGRAAAANEAAVAGARDEAERTYKQQAAEANVLNARMALANAQRYLERAEASLAQIRRERVQG